MTKRRRLCISISGGGIKGIFPVQFLSRLESYLGKSICEITHAYAGTSTGAIIAAGLAEGLSGTDLADLYINNCKKIFTKYPWYKRLKPSCPVYDNSNLKNILKSTFNGRMCDFKKPVFIPVTVMNGKSIDKVWDTNDSVEKWFAVLTSTAATRYFDVILKDKLSYTDGGFFNNSPEMTLQSGLKNSHPDWDIKVLTFNTGMNTPNTAFGNMNDIELVMWLLENCIANAGNSNYYELCANIGKENVFRINPQVNKSIKMDDTSDETIQKLIDIGNSEFDKVKKDLIDWINRG